MTLDPEHVADLLRRLALGELSEDDAEARALFDSCEEARAEWRELARMLRRLDQVQGEEEEDMDSTIRDAITDEDRLRVQAYFGPRLRGLQVERSRFDWAQPLRWWMPITLAAASGLLAFVLIPRGSHSDRPPAHGDLLGEEGPAGLSTTSEVLAGGPFRLAWVHTAERPRIPGTRYRLEVLPPSGEVRLVAELDAAEWTGTFEATDAGDDGRIAWRVRATSEGEDYAAGSGVVHLPE